MAFQKAKMHHRLIAALLAFAMILSYVPAMSWNVAAAEEEETTVYVLAGSDFQGTYDETNKKHVTDGVVSNINSILNSAGRDSYHGFLFLGDYALGADDGAVATDGTVKGLNTLKSAMSGITFTKQYYLQGNHDAAPTSTNGLTATGGYETDYYDVYALNWAQYGGFNSYASNQVAHTEDEIKAQATALETWLKGRTVGEKPIFVISHLPLHYTSRVYNEEGCDAQYAKYLFDVLNAAGQRGLNIVFMYGHNHSSYYDWYMGGSTNFVAKGETLWIADSADKTQAPQSRTVNFTYMNAGYVADSTSGPDNAQTMSVFEITGDDVKITRYDTQGKHALQAHAGTMHSNDVANGYTTDRDACDTANYTVYGDDLDVTVSSIVSTGDFHVGSYAAAYVTNPVAGATYSWTCEDTSVVSITDNGDGSVKIYGKAEGDALIRVTERSTNRVSEANYTEFYVHVFDSIVVETDGVIYQLATKLVPGKKYVFANRNRIGTATILKYDSSTTQGNLGYTESNVIQYNTNAPYIVQSPLTDTFTEASRNKLVWEAVKSDTEGFCRILNLYSGTYLQVNSAAEGVYIDLLQLGTGDCMSDLWGYDQNTGVYSSVTADNPLVPNQPRKNYLLTYGKTYGDDTRFDGKWWLVNAYRRDGNYFSRVYAYEERILTASATVSDTEGRVAVGAATTAETGSMIIKTWMDGQLEYIPVTVDMLRDQSGNAVSTASAAVHKNLNVVWNGYLISSGYTLIVGDSVDANSVIIAVAEGNYYRITNQFKKVETGNLHDEAKYLILNTNDIGNGKLMKMNSYGTGSARTASVIVTLDADGVPSVKSAALADNGEIVFQEWWYHKHSDNQWYLWQPNWNGTPNNNLRMADTTSGNIVGGDVSEANVLVAPKIHESTGISNYTTIQGSCGSSTGHSMYVEFKSDANDSDGNAGRFIGVNEANRTRGQEVYIYEKVVYNTATCALVSTHGHATQGSVTNTAYTGTKLLITYPDGTKEYKDVTLDMLYRNGTQLTADAINALALEDDGLTLTNVTVKYTDANNNGVVVSASYELHVMAADEAENPASPSPGHVDFSKLKDTSEFDFDETGVARVDLSTHGIPMDAKLDVLVVVDTSSSVDSFMDNGETRIEAMRASLNELVESLRQPNRNGSMPDVQLAVYEFNDYTYFGSPNTLLSPEGSVTHEPSSAHPTTASNAQVMDYTDIYSVGEFTAKELHAHMGTNYDVAMQMAYETVSARIAANGTDEREQVVIFMTDGICYQYNYLSYSETADHSEAWEKWLTGGMSADDLATYVPTAAQDWYNSQGKHWMAEAIKGSPDSKYKVIWNDNRTYDSALTYDAATHLLDDGIPGLGATLFTIGFGISIDGETSARVGEKILTSMASDPSKYYNADNAQELRDVFRDAVLSVQKAATNAYMFDQMGGSFDLQMGAVTNSKGETLSFMPTITIKAYDLFKTSEIGTVVNGVYVEEYMVGTRKSTSPTKILETVTFSADGKKAYSSCIGEGVNILSNGAINARYFTYNTLKLEYYLENGYTQNNEGAVVGIDLQPETFMWNIGEIAEQELVLSYYVYLENSMGEDGIGVAKGIYATNEYADLHYTNYQNIPCVIESVSPTLDWKSAQVTYRYYVVDEYGNIIGTSGGEGTFDNKKVVGTTTIDSSINLNVDYSVTPDNVPAGYMLYDPYAGYTINVNSGLLGNVANCGGEWTISGTTGTTYVEGYGGDPTTDTSHSSTTGNYANTTVWFAVVAINDSALTLNKVVSTTDKSDEFVLTLDAFANGTTSQITAVKPADIVLVLDQSSSMYTPLGWTKDRVNLEGGDTNLSVNAALSNYAITDFVSQANTAGSDVQENAKRMGYYLAVHNKAGENYIYLVHYTKNSNNQWNWYYISIDQTTRSIELTPEDYTNAVNYSDLNGADYQVCTWGNTAFTGFTYYKTQYGALVESVESFVDGLKASGVAHRVGIVGFASPFYDGWDHYDGSGLYVDGEFYLYDTDFMYKGTNTNGKLTYTDMGFVEENWTGDVILDPDKTFHKTSPVTTALPNSELQYAYSHSIKIKDSTGKETGETMYSKALADVSDAVAYDGILKSINAINANYQQTCPSVGIEMAEEIFKARSAETADRDKIMVLFTDGVPTVRLYSNREHGFSDDIFAKSLYFTISGGVEDALDRAAEAKANGVQIYTIGTAAMASATIGGTNINSGDFLNYMSSNYASVTYSDPDYSMISTNFSDYWKNRFDTNSAANGGEGTDMDPDQTNPEQSNKRRLYTYYNGYGYEEWTYYYKVTPVGASSNQIYSQFATGTSGQRSNDLNVAFGTIMESITVPSVTLNGSDILKEVLSDYFDLIGGANADIKVYTAPFNADGTVGARTEFADAQIQITTTDRANDTIIVSGYNYSEEYYSMIPRDRNGEYYYGSKLIVEVPVKVRSGFWGGNNVPTNKDTTAIYDVEGEKQTEVSPFPIPEVNVPMNLDIIVRDQVVYYGEDEITADDLFQKVTVNGVEAIYDPSTGKFIPNESLSWADDYADVTWVTGSGYSDLSTDVSGTERKDYTFAVVIKPKYDGSSNQSDHPSNLVGTANPKNGITDSDIASVDILVPVLTFKDSTIEMGEETAKEYYEEINRTGEVVWVNKDDPYGTAGYPQKPTEGFTTEPSLTLTYTPEGTGDNYFRVDTPVDVTVKADGLDITNVTYFLWVECHSGLHDASEPQITPHSGASNSHEFYIHVIAMTEDAVVIDFGIPVDIDVLFNDIIPENAKIVALKFGNTIPSSIEAFKDADGNFVTNASSVHGSIVITASGELRYQLAAMTMKTSDTFVYAAECDGVYYYSTVTVIPATIIYYEDNFVKFSVSGSDTSSGWSDAKSDNPEGIVFSELVQNDDRVGSADANIYGKDDAYSVMTQYSLGSAKKITVNANRTGTMTFKYWGTNFDVVSLTNGDTGTILVRVYQLDANGNRKDNYSSGDNDTTVDPYKSYFVNTYYGYDYGLYHVSYVFTDGAWQCVVGSKATNAKEEVITDVPANPSEGDKVDGIEYCWVVTPTEGKTLYQVPVIKSQDLPYGNYEVEITCSYSALFDTNKTDGSVGCYDFYLDAIRIYDPADRNPSDTVVKDAYLEDGEYLPTFEELREMIITADDFSVATDGTGGIVFIDGIPELDDTTASRDEYNQGKTAGISDYINYGPNNELYLAPGQAVAFVLNKHNAEAVHLAMKSVGATAKVKIYAAAAGIDVSDVKEQTISTATDLYYDISSLKNGSTVVIYNSGSSSDAILSITNVKSTYGESGSGEVTQDYTADPAAIAVALQTLGFETTQVQAPVLTPSYPTLSFEDEIHYNIYFHVSDGDVPAAADMGLISWYTYPEVVSIDSAEYVTGGASYVEADGSYMVTSQGIPAKNLADTLYFAVYAKLADGSYVYSDVYGYNAKAYAEDRLQNSTSDAMKALCVAMLNYGAAAQTQFGHNTDALMNEGLTAEDQALVAGYDASMLDDVVAVDSSKVGAFAYTAGGFKSMQPSVSFEGAFAINYYFAPAHTPDGDMTLYCWDLATYNSGAELTADNAVAVKVMTNDGTRYVGAFTDLAAKQIDETVFVCGVYECDGVRYSTGVLAYSIGAYCLDRIANGSETMQQLANATAVYGLCAKSYFANH